MTMTSYNILYLDNSNGIGGGQRSLLLLLQYLDSTRFRAFLGCPKNSELANEAQNAGHTVFPLDLPQQHDKQDKVQRFTFQQLMGDLQQVGAIGGLVEIIKTQQVDLIHANSLAAGLIGGLAARLTGVPVVMHKRYATSYGLLDRICEALLDKVILVSEATRWPFASEDKQALIYNGIALDGLQVAPEAVSAARTKYGLDDNTLVVGTITRITPEKGIHVLIEAVAQLSHLPNVVLLIVGGPYFPEDVAYMEQLKTQAKRLGVAERVIFTGFISDVRAVTATLDISLLASTIPEACPRAVIEAMAAGRAVIGTHLGGTQELVTPETGILVPPEDATAFAQAIEQLNADPKRLKQMGEQGRIRVEQFFDIETNTRLTEDVYRRVLVG